MPESGKDNRPGKRARSILVSFSGLDGSGKSTQIENLRATLAARGYSSKLLAFWDNVVVFTRYRESFVHAVYKSQQGVGAPGKPVERRDKNVRRWYLSFIRHGLYFADALHLAWVLASVRARRRSANSPGVPDVLIIDRYIYDELANLPLANPLTRIYVRLVAALVPRPDVAFLLDADPEAALARKPEYPVDFMHKCRAAYKELARLLGNITIIPPLDLAEAKQRVVEEFWAAAKLDAPRTSTQIIARGEQLPSDYDPASAA
jgi:thymidylate kinase